MKSAVKRNYCLCGLPARFLCRACWRKVPAHLRREIHTYRRNGNADELQRARAAAIRALAPLSGGGKRDLHFKQPSFDRT